MTELHVLQRYGQSVWIDELDRRLITSGELRQWLDQGVSGITSNPTIFQKALQHSRVYEPQLIELVRSGSLATEALFEAVMIQDIQDTADILRPIYAETEDRDGRDGFVSLEVDPQLAHNTHETIAAVRRLRDAVNRPNVMFKIPATPAGIPAVEQLISEGININITLMFSMEHYEQVARAYINGIKRLAENGGSLSQVNSVASFFISRIDSKLDEHLANSAGADLQGRIGIANAKVVYDRFRGMFSSAEWQPYSARGARTQRVLWASTSTKNPAYPDTMYVDNLVGEYTINTMPIETLKAFLDHGRVEPGAIGRDLDGAQEQLRRLEALGIDLDRVGRELQDEGLEKFSRSYQGLLDLLDQRRAELQREVSP